MGQWLDALPNSQFMKIISILNADLGDRFTIPYMELCGDVVVMYLRDINIEHITEAIEITSKEAEQIIDPKNS